MGYLHLVSVVAASVCLFHPVPEVWFVIPTVVNGITWCMSFFGQFSSFHLDRAFAKRVLAWLASTGVFGGLIPLCLCCVSVSSSSAEDDTEDFHSELTIFCVGVFAIPALGCLLYWLCHACCLWRCTLPCHRFHQKAPAQTPDKPSGSSLEQKPYHAGCLAGECPLKQKVSHLFEHMRVLHEEVSPLKAHMQVLHDEVNPLKVNVDQLFEKMCAIEAALQDLSQHHKRASAEEERPQCFSTH